MQRRRASTSKRVLLVSLGMLGGAAFAASALGQVGHKLDHPVGESLEWNLDSGFHANPDNEAQVVHLDLVHVENGAWVRLYFGETSLPPGSFLRLTSTLDGEVQELDAAGLLTWGGTSGYFNGDSVLVELVAAPNSRGNRFSVIEVATEFPVEDPAGDCGICGVDERFSTTEEWACRLLPAGCTASVYTEDGCLVSAGHCVGGSMVVEFRVPLSNPNCTLNHPPIEEQFPITDFDYRNSGVGADWSVMTSGANNLGESPYQRYGVLRPIAVAPASVGDPIDVWGYAVDNDCTLTQTQQQSPNGEITFRSSSHYEYNADITFGNSGSSIIQDGEIIGIVTHCSFGCPNYGTRVDNSDFAEARDDLCGLGRFDLGDPVPGFAGQNNTLTLVGGVPGETVDFMYSLRTGSASVPGCSGVFMGLNLPILAGSDVADSSGVASITGFVPLGALNKTIHFQCRELATCRVSNLVSYRMR